MKRKFLVFFLLIVSAACLALGVFACASGGGTDSTTVMEEGVVYFTDFSIKYTSAADSPNGDINESSLNGEIWGYVQSYYLVMDFNMQLASNTDGLEYLTVKFVVLDANVVETIINYADTSNTSAITSDGQTTVTATFSMPDKAKSVKNINLVLELKPKTLGATDIIYSFSSDTKQISCYKDEDITYNYTSSNISISNTSLEYTLNDDGQSYSVTGIGTKSGTVIYIIYIKSTYNGLTITSIGDSVFSDCTSLKSITIPNSVTSIGDSAFENCTSLTSLTIPDSTISIGEYAFSGCTSLKSITIPNSINSIGDSAFEDCTSLTYYEYENGYYLGNDNNNYVVLIEAIDTSIEFFNIHSNVKVISYQAFYQCTALESIIIPDSVTSIGYSAFQGCTALTKITIPDSVTSIGDGTFNNCTSLTSVTIPDSVTSIGDSAFSVCTSLTSITIPDSVTSIGDSAFWFSSLTSIAIGNSVTSIGDSAFSGCIALTSITIPDSVTSIGSGAFYLCVALTSIAIGNSVTSIGDSAFKNCSSLTSITIPDSVTYIGYRAFYWCSKLKSVTFENASVWYVSISSTYTNDTYITSSDLSDTSTAAMYLRGTYCSYFWYRNGTENKN